MTMVIPALLRSRNRCLERIIAVTREFIAAPAPSVEDDGAALDALNVGRESAMKAIELLDRKIADALACFNPADRTPSLIAEVQEAQAQNDQLVRQIFDLDREVLARIEEAGKILEKELSSSRKSRQILGKFKSTWVAPSGEGLDSKA